VSCVPKVCCDFRKYTFHIYAEARESRHAPHLHVEWPDDGCVLLLPTLDMLVGPSLPVDVQQHILENLDTIIAEWNRLNPSRGLE
jgi:hypothetical protein